MNQEQNLKWLILSGVTETVGEQPVNRLKSNQAERPIVAPAVKEEANTPSDLHLAEELATSAQNLTDLYEKRAGFEACPLKKTAMHTLNGRGVLNPNVMCIIEAPDTIDEKEGRLMSGEAGSLLDKMLNAIGLNLNQNAYVTSLIPWRPPGNRAPTEAELALCRPFWEKEIDLIAPKIVLLMGGGVSKALLGISALSKARGSWHTYRGLMTRVSLAPATLLKLPAQKRQAWEDLQQIKTKLDEI